MSKVLVCVPSELPGGLDAEISSSFEESAVYNFLEIDDGKNPPEISFSFQRFSCHAVACLDPIEAIAKKGAIVLIIKSISPHFLIRFLESGVKIFSCNERTIKEAVKAYSRNDLIELNRNDYSTLKRK